MASLVDLLTRILDEQRKKQQFRSDQELRAQQIASAQQVAEGNRFDLDVKRQQLAADTELAVRRYPGMDPTAALVKMRADDMAEKRDTERRGAEAQIASRDAQALSAQMLANYRQDKIEQSPEEKAMAEAKLINEQNRAAMHDALLARIMQQLEGRYNPDLHAQDPPRGGGKPPKEHVITQKEYDKAKAQLKAAGNLNPSPEEVRAKAKQNYAEVTGIGAPASSSPAPSPPTVPKTVADEAGCRALGGTIGPDGKCHVSRR